jgi:hypothetical protein
MVGSILPVLALVGTGGAMVTLPMTLSGALICIVVCCSAPEYVFGRVAVGTGGGVEALASNPPPWSLCGFSLVGGGGAFLAFPGLLVMSFLMVMRSRLFSASCSYCFSIIFMRIALLF